MNLPALLEKPAGLLGALALAGLGLVSVLEFATRERIAENRRAVLLREMEALVPARSFDNDLLADRVAALDPRLGTGEPVAVHRARKNGRPVALLLSPVAPNGYSGAIRLLAAIRPDGTLAGVRVLEHRETPGLGDAIEARRSNWILGFEGRSLGNPEPLRWKVRRDGGDFDQFAGATVTPRAVVQSVYEALVFFKDRRDRLFEAPAGSVLKE